MSYIYDNLKNLNLKRYGIIRDIKLKAPTKRALLRLHLLSTTKYKSQISQKSQSQQYRKKSSLPPIYDKVGRIIFDSLFYSPIVASTNSSPHYCTTDYEIQYKKLPSTKIPTIKIKLKRNKSIYDSIMCTIYNTLTSNNYPRVVRCVFMYSRMYNLRETVFHYDNNCPSKDIDYIIAYRRKSTLYLKKYIDDIYCQSEQKQGEDRNKSSVFNTCVQACCKMICPSAKRLRLDMKDFDVKKKVYLNAIAVEGGIIQELVQFGLIDNDFILQFKEKRKYWFLTMDMNNDCFMAARYKKNGEIAFVSKKTMWQLMKFLKYWISKINKSKKEFFQQVVNKIVLNKRGTLKKLLYRLQRYLTRCTIFSYKLELKKGYEYITYLKKRDLHITFSKKDNYFQYIKTQSMYWRDLYYFLPSDKLTVSDINLQHGYSNSHISNKVSDIITFYIDFSTFICENFGYFLECENYYSISTLFYHISFNYGPVNPFNLGVFKLSPKNLQQFTLFAQGGLSFNTASNVCSGDAIRKSMDCNEPIRSLVSYDLKSNYGSSFDIISNRTPAGQLMSYSLKENSNTILIRDDPGVKVLRAEQEAVLMLIYEYSSPKLDYFISSVYSSFHNKRQFSIDKMSIDLVLTLTHRNECDLKRFLFFNIHERYFHGYCPEICQPNNSRFVGGRDGEALAHETQEKNEKLTLFIKQQFGKFGEFVPVYTCHHQCPDSYDKNIVYLSVDDFMERCNHPSIAKYKPYRRLKKCISADEILSSRLNYFVIAKIELPTDSSYGFNVVHRCNACHEESSSDNHSLKLIAANKPEEFGIYSDDYFKFLISLPAVKPPLITHVWFFAASDSFKPFVKKMLHLRRLCVERGLIALSKAIKFGLNSTIGYFGKKSDKPPQKIRLLNSDNSLSINTYRTYRSSKGRGYIKIYPLGHDSTFISDYSDKNENGDYIIRTDGKIFFQMETSKTRVTWKSFYANQFPLVLSFQILQMAKLQLVQIFKMYRDYFDDAKFRLLYVHVDSTLLALSDEDGNILSCVKPERRQEFINHVYPLFFCQIREPDRLGVSNSQNDDSEDGKLKLEYIVTDKLSPFTFQSHHSLHYEITQSVLQQDAIKDERKIKECGRSAGQVLNQGHRLILERYDDSVPF